MLTDKQYSKPTAEEALWESMVLWKELCEAEHYEGGRSHYISDIKRHAIKKLQNDGALPLRAKDYYSLCAFCELYCHNSCSKCPWPGSGNERCCDAGDVYRVWRDHPHPTLARPVFNLMAGLQYKHIVGKQACAGKCKCTGKDEGRMEFKVGDRVKLLDGAGGSTTDPTARYPKWNNTRVGGTITGRPAIDPWIRWDNGVETSVRAGLFAHLSTDERLALANRDIRPGDVFIYWDGDAEELLTLIAVDDGCDDADVVLLDPVSGESSDSIQCDKPERYNALEYAAVDIGEFELWLERLVPVGRGHLTIVMDE